MTDSNILIYQNENGNIKVDIRFENELNPSSTVWNYRTVQSLKELEEDIKRLK